MKKLTLAFDMDGTIADLYGREHWLHDLKTGKKGLFANLETMVNMTELTRLCEGFEVIVITWLPMTTDLRLKNISVEEYKLQVAKEKIQWIEKHFPIATTIHPLDYGVNKADVLGDSVRTHILVDDNKDVRAMFEEEGGITIDAQADILEQIRTVRKVLGM